MSWDPQLNLNIGLWPRWLVRLFGSLPCSRLLGWIIHSLPFSTVIVKNLCTLLQIQYTMKEQNKLRLIVTSLGRKFKMVIKTFHIPTRHQIADFFTKAPGQKQFFYLLSKMKLFNIYSSSWGGVLNCDNEGWRKNCLNYQ